MSVDEGVSAVAEQSPAAQIDEPRGWSLDDLFSERDEVEAAAARIEELRRRADELASARDELEAVDGARLLELLGLYRDLMESSVELSGYANLRFAAATQDGAALALRNRIDQALTPISNRVLFFTLWWQTIEEERAAELLRQLGDAGVDEDTRFFLESLRRQARYRLDERSEQIINLKDADGIHGVLTLYSLLTNAFSFRPALDGVELPADGLTRDELTPYVYSQRRAHRLAAYESLLAVYAEQGPVLGQMYVHRLRDWHAEQVELRGYPSAIAVRNAANDLPDEAVEALLQAIRDGAPVFQRFFRYKASRLGLERLRREDVYAPLPTSAGAAADAEEKVPFGEAVDLVIRTFEGFHPEFGAGARRVVDQDHLDAEIRRGKKGGAFCATVTPRHVPWVLVNYSGTLRDVATLAHELGHAVHSVLAAEHSVLTQHPTLPLAETASVFGEILVTERLLERTESVAARRSLLSSAMDDVYATVARQAYFVLFEERAHRAVAAGASVDDLDRLYLETLGEQFGDAVEVPAAFAREWMAIPHIYAVPFYCYAYAFGQLLVLALYQRFQEEGDEFKKGYLRLLAHGGAARPMEILAEVGVDPTSPEFWAGGMELVAARVEELETLADEE